MDCSTPGFPVHHQLPELAQTHVHRVSDAIQPSHPLSSPFPHTFNLSQHQGLFQWVSSSHQIAKVLKLHFQCQSFHWIFRTDFFRIAWFDLLEVQGIHKSLLQHHSSKAAILQHSASYCPQPLLINQRCSETPGCPAPRYPFPVEINQTWPYLGGHPWLSGKRGPPKEATAIWAYKWVRFTLPAKDAPEKVTESQRMTGVGLGQLREEDFPGQGIGCANA